MKKFLVLLVAACCLFASCEKEGGNSSLDGSTWVWESFHQYKLVFDNNYVTSYYKGSLYDTQTYKVKGDKVHFGDFLQTAGYTEYFYDKIATLSSDKTRMTLRIGHIENGAFIESDDSSTIVYIRVTE